MGISTAVEKHGSRPDCTPDMTRLLLKLVAMLDSHDPLLAGHGERVSAYSDLLGRAIGLPDSDRELLRWSALIHDTGKLDVSSAILSSPSPPSEEEWQAIRTHPEKGWVTTEALRPWLGDWLLAVSQHHERFDGTGYPAKLSATEISLAGRIVAIADSFDVITSWRSYKKQARPEEGRAELARCAGAQFDPELVRAFLSVSLGEIKPILQNPS